MMGTSAIYDWGINPKCSQGIIYSEIIIAQVMNDRFGETITLKMYSTPCNRTNN